MVDFDLKSYVCSVDPDNAEYILADIYVQRKYGRYLWWIDKFKEECSGFISSKAATENYKKVISETLEQLKQLICNYSNDHLTPANVSVGQGATINYWSDRHAGTIVKVTKCSITIQRDTAILSPDFSPQFILGGFSAFCTNQREQKYTYEPNDSGELVTIRWSKKYNRYGRPGQISASKGRHEFYDYNF